VEDLLKSERYATEPDERDLVATLRLTGLGKDYGQRLRGWLTPDVDGPARFWISADDGAELWLGTDETPESARLIAFVPGWSAMQEWEKYPEQASQPVELQAGVRYYIEIRHKQADQRDGLAVAWQPPGGERGLLQSPHLTPWP
jgi:hypothetical protein